MRKINEVLQDARLAKGLKLVDVSKATKIRREFLEAIEDARYHDLPSESYALGFVKNYASFVGVDKTKAAALFRREFESSQGKLLPTFKSRDSKRRRRLLFTPKSFLVILVFCVVAGYIALQYSSLLFGPKLEVIVPKEGQVVEENILEVKGKTDPYATVSVNNDNVYVKLDGTFKKTLYMFEGKRKIQVVAKNRNGKGTTQMINVEVR